jgi:hypothetical protein
MNGIQMNKKVTLKRKAKRAAVLGSVIAVGFALLPGTASALEAPLSLATASTYGVLANTAVTTATPSNITGSAGANIGVGVGGAPTGTLSTSGVVTVGGAALTALVSASSALADVRSGTSTLTELGSRTLVAGAYTGGELAVNGTLTLDGAGSADSVFIFRAASTLTTGVSSSVVLINGAQACNVYWQVGSSATLGASSTMTGHVIAQASISTGATSVVNGQLIAVTGAVTLGGTTIINNGCTSTPVVVTPPVVTPPVVTPPVVTSAETVPVVEPAPAIVATGTLRIVKRVMNVFGGQATASSFIIHVRQNGLEVAGSPASAVEGDGRTYILEPGNYILSEERTNGYRGLWSGNISTGGSITLVAGQDLTVVRTNYDMNPTDDATEVVIPTPTTTPKPTVNGGKLPDTSSPWWNLLLLGGGLVALSGVGFTSRKFITK